MMIHANMTVFRSCVGGKSCHAFCREPNTMASVTGAHCTPHQRSSERSATAGTVTAPRALLLCWRAVVLFFFNLIFVLAKSKRWRMGIKERDKRQNGTGTQATCAVLQLQGFTKQSCCSQTSPNIV